jgi:hypothetical protein
VGARPRSPGHFQGEELRHLPAVFVAPTLPQAPRLLRADDLIPPQQDSLKGVVPGAVGSRLFAEKRQVHHVVQPRLAGWHAGGHRRRVPADVESRGDEQPSNTVPGMSAAYATVDPLLCPVTSCSDACPPGRAVRSGLSGFCSLEMQNRGHSTGGAPA